MSESDPTSASAVRHLDLKARKKYSAAEVIILLNENNFTHAISEDDEIRGCTMFRISEATWNARALYVGKPSTV
jgi:hypothetical protein